MHDDRDLPATPQFGTRGALVCVDDARTALATMLLLQEFGHAVDLVDSGDAAVAWAGAAHYDLIMLGENATEDRGLQLALHIRYVAPTPRVILIGDEHAPADGLDILGIEVLRAPISVNQLVDRLRLAA